MTSQPTIEPDTEPTAPLSREHLGTGRLGSSVYGGRPTFALVRREEPDGAFLTLYELLPAEQARTRRERLERMKPNTQLVVDPFEEVFEGSDDLEIDRWDWDDWSAVKVTRLSGSRLRSLLPLVHESLHAVDVDEETVTSGGRGERFLPESVGVRLALGFLGIKPIQRVDRMRAFTRGIAGMSDEECYYWHAKCRSPSSPNGDKALRTLLTDHI